MPPPAPARSTPLQDAAWRIAYRLGYPLARAWWRLTRSRREGALVAVHVGPALLLLQSSYRIAWNFPGGGVHPGETPEAAARRELIEEIGLTAAQLRPHGIFASRRGRTHLFELRLDRLPELRLDNREIVAARLVLPEQARRMRLTAAVAFYLATALPQPAPPR